MIRIDAANATRQIGFEARSRTIGSPEEVLVAWLVALPEGLDPAHAAQIAIDRIARSKIEANVPTRLRELLLEVARCPADRCPAPIGRRRRGKSEVFSLRGMLT
jgi:hypothetical protein